MDAWWRLRLRFEAKAAQNRGEQPQSARAMKGVAPLERLCTLSVRTELRLDWRLGPKLRRSEGVGNRAGSHRQQHVRRHPLAPKDLLSSRAEGSGVYHCLARAVVAQPTRVCA